MGTIETRSLSSWHLHIVCFSLQENGRKRQERGQETGRKVRIRKDPELIAHHGCSAASWRSLQSSAKGYTNTERLPCSSVHGLWTLDQGQGALGSKDICAILSVPSIRVNQWSSSLYQHSLMVNSSFYSSKTRPGKCASYSRKLQNFLRVRNRYQQVPQVLSQTL